MRLKGIVVLLLLLLLVLLSSRHECSHFVFVRAQTHFRSRKQCVSAHYREPPQWIACSPGKHRQHSSDPWECCVACLPARRGLLPQGPCCGAGRGRSEGFRRTWCSLQAASSATTNPVRRGLLGTGMASVHQPVLHHHRHQGSFNLKVNLGMLLLKHMKMLSAYGRLQMQQKSSIVTITACRHCVRVSENNL